MGDGRWSGEEGGWRGLDTDKDSYVERERVGGEWREFVGGGRGWLWKYSRKKGGGRRQCLGEKGDRAAMRDG